MQHRIDMTLPASNLSSQVLRQYAARCLKLPDQVMTHKATACMTQAIALVRLQLLQRHNSVWVYSSIQVTPAEAAHVAYVAYTRLAWLICTCHDQLLQCWR